MAGLGRRGLARLQSKAQAIGIDDLIALRRQRESDTSHHAEQKSLHLTARFAPNRMESPQSG